MKEICVNCKGEEKTAYERRGHKKAGRKEMTTGLDEDRDIAHMAQTQTHKHTQSTPMFQLISVHSDNREAPEACGLTLVSHPWETKSKSQFTCNTGQI